MFVNFLRQFSLNILALAIITTPITVSMSPIDSNVGEITELISLHVYPPYIAKSGGGTLLVSGFSTLPADSPEVISNDVWYVMKTKTYFPNDELSEPVIKVTTNMPFDRLPIKIEGGFVTDCNGLTSSNQKQILQLKKKE